MEAHGDMEDSTPAIGAIVGQRIREARTARALTQKDLAQTLDIRENDVRRWETGRNLPTPARLPELASVLDISLDWLFGLSDNGPNEEKRPRRKRV